MPGRWAWSKKATSFHITVERSTQVLKYEVSGGRSPYSMRYTWYLGDPPDRKRVIDLAATVLCLSGYFLVPWRDSVFGQSLRLGGSKNQNV